MQSLQTINKLSSCSDGGSDEDQSSVVRRDKKGDRANPMIQRVKKKPNNDDVIIGIDGIKARWFILFLLRLRRWKEKLFPPARVKMTLKRRRSRCPTSLHALRFVHCT